MDEEKLKSLENRQVPSSTYRLQFNREFTFSQAADLVDYLDHLGIGACYASPLLRARSGSVHGYDITDHSQLNPEIGSEEQFRELAEKLRQHNMGLIVDVVPNHMCITDPSNVWWWDVLENGPSSRYARFFDIDWHPPKQELENKVLLPFLPDQFGRVLESGEIRVVFKAGAFHIVVDTLQLPVGPHSWHLILDPVRHALRHDLGDTNPDFVELESVMTAIHHLPTRTETDPEKVRERQREKEVIKRRLEALSGNNGRVHSAIEGALKTINGMKGDPRSFDRLERLLEDQAYRLSYWRVAADEINYRRFFDIHELAAIRVEDPEVFEAVHKLILDFIRAGYVTGLRVDHPDGLFEPERYFHEMQKACGSDGASRSAPLFVVAEKILVGDERLRSGWEIAGTVGYDFLNALNGAFVDSTKRTAFHRLYERITDWTGSYDDLVYYSKKLILQVSMSSELNVLSRKLDGISEQHRWSRDFTLENLRDALREVVACFPIYRTYISSDSMSPDAEDERHIRAAIATAKVRNPAMSESVFDFIQSILLLQDPEGISEEQRVERRMFVMRLQQFTGPVMAKGLEDTAFYRYAPLASLNEVGGAADRFGISPATFHSRSQTRHAAWPQSMLATSTHDTKRSEDVRARINALSEIPGEWYRNVRRWQHLNLAKKTAVSGVEAPTANEEYLLYQTLVGSWPFAAPESDGYSEYVQRIHTYMEKAVREAKLHTSWISPNCAYERALHLFIDGLLQPSDNQFLEDFLPFQARIARAGIWNSLSQLLLKIASPGTPDFYQGTELWDFSLADPDNRRTVDFKNRKALLQKVKSSSSDSGNFIGQLLAEPQDGAIKLHVTQCGLAFRKANQELFVKGAYHGLKSAGPQQRHVISFSRTLRRRTAIVVAGRFFMSLGGDRRDPIGDEIWSESYLVLPRRYLADSFHDVLTGQTITPEPGRRHILSLAKVFSQLPIALLVSN